MLPVGDQFTFTTSAEISGVSVVVCPVLMVISAPADTVGIGNTFTG